MITQRVRCDCTFCFNCIPKPAYRALRRQIDGNASSLNVP